MPCAAAETDPMKLAAIDIGSNAIRMVIAEHTPIGLEMIKKYRFPIRLGSDVFDKGQISAKNLKQAARTFKKFKELSEEYKVVKLKAVATSAMRESKNSKAFIELIRRKSGIKIEVIDGVEEAKLIHLAVKKEVHLDKRQALLLDIGGGSVELTVSDQTMMTGTQSFPFGTVRILELMKKKKLSESQINLVLSDFISPLSHFVESQAKDIKFDFMIGTGGNLETLAKLKPILLKATSRSLLTQQELSTMIQKLQKMSVKDRISELKMRPDRADVIIPAALLTQTVMRLAGIDKLVVPHVGLKDGILWSIASA